MYNGKVFSSLQDLTGTKDIVKTPENLTKVNWILNQDFVGQQSTAGGEFSYLDIQYAMWDLISTLNRANPKYTPEILARVDEIIYLAKDYEEKYGPYKPGSGDIVSIIFKIEEAQNVIIEYPVPNYLEADAWGKGEYFNKKENTAMHFIYEFSK